MAGDDIRVREVIVDKEFLPATSPTKPGELDVKARVEFSTFITDGMFDMSKTLDPLVDKFKKENNLK